MIEAKADLTINYPTLFRKKFPRSEYSAPSGRILSVDFNCDYVKITDKERPDFYMTAYYVPDHRIFHLDLRTRTDNQFDYLLHGRHPDMHARQFVIAAYGYFKGKGHNIRVCQGLWLPTSDNLQQYQHARIYMPSHDAALQTWSGRIFSQLGYSKVDQLEEHYYVDGKTVSKVQVDFVKPE